MKSNIFFTNVKLSLNLYRSFIARLTKQNVHMNFPAASPLAQMTLKRYFLFPLPFAKLERETGLTKWLCAPGNRSTGTPERIWAVTDVPSATFSADADSKEEEDLVKVLVDENPLAPLESDWWIDWKNQVITSQ